MCIGTFSGQTSSYSMRDKDGNAIRINGNTIDVPAIDNTIVVDKDAITIKQESDGKVLEGKGKARLVHVNPQETLIESEVFFEPNSHPTYQIRYDSNSRSITLIQLSGGTPPTPLCRENS